MKEKIKNIYLTTAYLLIFLELQVIHVVLVKILKFSTNFTFLLSKLKFSYHINLHYVSSLKYLSNAHIFIFILNIRVEGF
jgi:hypothetical protein